MTNLPTQLKADIDSLAERIADSIKVSVPASTIRETIKKFYTDGQKEIGIRFGIKPKIIQERLKTLENFTIGTIKFLNDDIHNKLRSEIIQGLINLEDLTQIRKRIQKVVDMSIQRAELIARTESNRALNSGYLDSARQSKLTLMKEWVSAPDDGRRSKVCTHLDRSRIKLDEKFKYDGEEFDAPPAHPNCRSRLIFVQV